MSVATLMSDQVSVAKPARLALSVYVPCGRPTNSNRPDALLRTSYLAPVPPFVRPSVGEDPARRIDNRPRQLVIDRLSANAGDTERQRHQDTRGCYARPP